MENWNECEIYLVLIHVAPDDHLLDHVDDQEHLQSVQGDCQSLQQFNQNLICNKNMLILTLKSFRLRGCLGRGKEILVQRFR